GKKVELHNLGTLSLDPEKNISFESFPEINFLVDSFGLASFQSMPVVPETITEKRKPIERIDRPVAVGPVADEILEAKPVRNRTRRVLVTSAIVTPVLVAAFWLSTQTTNGFAGFGFFGKKEVSKFQPVKWFTKASKDTLGIITELKTDANGIARISLTENAPEIIVDIHKVVPDSTMVAQTNLNLNASYNGKRYYIIGGCFEMQENVERFIKALKSKGYNPQVIDQVRSHLTHVGIAAFNSKEEAVEYLSRISSDVPGAWILKK
ncbi:MAG TPA: SPOR domain-containing protein, partial [Bacteroidia bacterium]|nr:SPOR domain-containing protein [Bacteroidia bacterium]